MARRRATIPPFMHVGAQYVHANCTRSATASASYYIQRLREVDVRDRCAIVDAASYMLRRDQLEAARNEVVGHKFFSRGNLRAEDVWAAVDEAARTKKGLYSQRGGGMPRLAILAEFSFPWGLSESEKVRLAHEMAQAIVDEYGAAVEVVCHRKQDHPERGIDHAHFLISMYEVDAAGVVGPKIRRFNGIFSSMSVERVVVGGRALSGHMVWMRRTWATMLSNATGEQYEWLSYADMGLEIEPIRNVSRARIEKERREGKSTWRAERDAFLADRQRNMSRQSRNQIERRDEPARAGSLAAELVKEDPRLRILRSFSPAAILAMRAANAHAGKIKGTPAAQPDLRARQSDVRTASGSAAAKPTQPPSVPVVPSAARVGHASVSNSFMRPVTAIGPSAVSSKVAEDPKAQVSSLVERQWQALYEKQHAADMQRFFEDIDARARPAKPRASQPTFHLPEQERVKGAIPPAPMPPSQGVRASSIPAPQETPTFPTFQILEEGSVKGTIPAAPPAKSQALQASGSAMTTAAAPPNFRRLEEGTVEGTVSPVSPSYHQAVASALDPAPYAIAFGAALIAAGWRTDRGETALAAHAGMERGAFSAKTVAMAAELKEQKKSAVGARMQARQGAPVGLPALFDELEDERREAKRRRARQVQVTERAAASATEATAGDEKQSRAASIVQSSMSSNFDAQATESPELATSTATDRASDDFSIPLSGKSVELLFKLAALLSRRGLLQPHLSEIVRITGLSMEIVKAQANNWLSAFGQMKTPMRDIWKTVVSEARSLGDPQLTSFVERIAKTTDGPTSPGPNATGRQSKSPMVRPASRKPER